MQRIVRNQRKHTGKRSLVFRKSYDPKINWTFIQELIFSLHVRAGKRWKHTEIRKGLGRDVRTGKAWELNIIDKTWLRVHSILLFYLSELFFFLSYVSNIYSMLKIEKMENYLASKWKISFNLPFRQANNIMNVLVCFLLKLFVFYILKCSFSFCPSYMCTRL